MIDWTIFGAGIVIGLMVGVVITRFFHYICC